MGVESEKQQKTQAASYGIQTRELKSDALAIQMWVARAMAVSRAPTSCFRLQPLASLTTKLGAGLPPLVVVLMFASWKAGCSVARGAQVPPNLHLFLGVLDACLGASPVAHRGLQILSRGLWGPWPVGVSSGRPWGRTGKSVPSEPLPLPLSQTSGSNPDICQ